MSGFVEKKLLGRLLDTVNRLVEFEDTQAATYLLRVSFSIVLAVHFMRTTPLDQWREQASKFDGMIRAAIEKPHVASRLPRLGADHGYVLWNAAEGVDNHFAPCFPAN